MANQRDSRVITETVRRSEARPLEQPNPTGVASNPRARAAKATKNLAKFELHSFTLQKNKPDEFEDSDGKRKAFAACPIAKESDVLLIPCGGEASGGYWMAMPCGAANEPIQSEDNCIDFSDNAFPLPSLNIENLVDTATEPQFDGWAEEVNGRFDMTQLFPPTQVFNGDGNVQAFTDCSPAVIIEVPDNATGTNINWPQGPLQITWKTNPTNVALFFDAGVRIVGGLGFKEQVRASCRENGADEYPRSNRKLVAESEYKEWAGTAAYTGAGDSTGDADLRAWLANGIFILYPTS